MKTETETQKHTVPFLYLFLLVIAIAVCGCTGENQPTTADAHTPEDNLYLYARNNQYGILNAQGEFVFPMQKNQLYIIKDQFTKEPKYIVMTEILPGEIPEGSYEPEDLYWNTTYRTALYDTEGNEIYGMTDKRSFGMAFGSYLQIYENNQSFLYDMTTGKKVMDGGYFNIQTEKEMLVFSDYDAMKSRIYDKDLHLIKELDYYINYTIYDGEKPYFVVSRGDFQGLMDTTDFHLLLPCQYNWINDINGNFVQVGNSENSELPANQVIDMTTGEVVYQQDGYISYYDGAICIAQKEPQTEEDEKENGKQMELRFLNEPEKNRTFKEINIHQTADKDPSAMLLQCTNEDGTKVVLDREGTEQMTLDENQWFMADGDYLFLETFREGDTPVPVKIMKRDGTEILTEKSYEYVNTGRGEMGDEYGGYLEAGYRTPQGDWQVDILDPDGKILVEHIQPYAIGYFEYDYCDGYRIIARKGFSQGMMDMKGNWLYKESMFDTMGIRD